MLWDFFFPKESTCKKADFLSRKKEFHPPKSSQDSYWGWGTCVSGAFAAFQSGKFGLQVNGTEKYRRPSSAVLWFASCLFLRLQFKIQISVLSGRILPGDVLGHVAQDDFVPAFPLGEIQRPGPVDRVQQESCFIVVEGKAVAVRYP